MSVRYVVNGDNTDLRYALWIIWDRRCYWNNHLISTDVLQIDHVVSRKAAAENARSPHPDLPRDFDVHAVENLAPICGSCNRLKHDNYSVTGFLLQAREKARLRASDVVTEVLSMRAEPEVAKALRTVINVGDLDGRARSLMRTHGGVLMQKCHAVGASLVLNEAIDVLPSKYAGFEHVTLSTRLDEQGRITRSIVREIYGTDWDDLLRDVVVAVADGVEDEIVPDIMRVAASRTSGRVGNPSVEVDSKNLTLTLDDAVRTRTPTGAFEVELRLSFEADVVASLSVPGEDGTGLDDFVGEGAVSAQCLVALAWWPGDFDPITVQTEDVMYSRTFTYADVY